MQAQVRLFHLVEVGHTSGQHASAPHGYLDLRQVISALRIHFNLAREANFSPQRELSRTLYINLYVYEFMCIDYSLYAFICISNVFVVF